MEEAVRSQQELIGGGSGNVQCVKHHFSSLPTPLPSRGGDDSGQGRSEDQPLNRRPPLPPPQLPFTGLSIMFETWWGRRR